MNRAAEEVDEEEAEQVNEGESAEPSKYEVALDLSTDAQRMTNHLLQHDGDEAGGGGQWRALGTLFLQLCGAAMLAQQQQHHKPTA